MTHNNYSLRILEHVNLILRFKSQREKRQASGQKSKNTSTKVIFDPIWPHLTSAISPIMTLNDLENFKACQVIGILRFSEDVEEARGLICCVIPLMSINNREICLPSNSFFILTDLKFVVNKIDSRWVISITLLWSTSSY